MYLTYSQLGFFALCMLGLGACFGVLIMSMLAIARLGEDQLAAEPPFGYVDQDGESTPGRDDWKHSSVKVPHADATAATFHREA